MAQNERVNPNCSYASNPYHECTEACLRKITETQPQKNKKSSDYGRTVTDGQLGKKINDEKQTHSGCPKASNPYHRCHENCNKRMSEADSGVIPLNFGWKKKTNSMPIPPVVDSVPASKVRANYYSEKKKVEPKTNEHISYESVSLGEYIQDVKPVHRKEQGKDDVEHFANNHTQTWQPVYQKDQAKDDFEHFANNHTKTNQEDDKKASDKMVPSTYPDDTGEGLTASAGRLLNFSFSGISITNDSEDSEERESVASEVHVPIGRYHVRESYAPILRSILDKYGDIGASFQLESVIMRTYYIECVCFVVQELQSTSITQFTKSKLKELFAILKDVESAQLQVAWLRSILNEVAEHTELINQHKAVEMAKANSDSEVESLREELESELKTLAQKEQEVATLKTRIAETRERLRELELKSSELEKSMSLIKSKVDGLDGKSLIGELL